MINVILFASYFLSSCSGLVLMKYGSMIKDGLIFKIPIVNSSLSLVSLSGFFCYGVSFLLYVILVSRYELSFLNPFSVGVTSIMIFVAAAIFFGEVITISKIVGLALILLGVVIINVYK